MLVGAAAGIQASMILGAGMSACLTVGTRILIGAAIIVLAGDTMALGGGYAGNRHIYPYRYQQPSYRRAEPKVIAPPERVTTSVSYATGLTHLPENARVVHKDGRTVYEWQGVEYQFDWSTKTYQKVEY